MQADERPAKRQRHSEHTGRLYADTHDSADIPPVQEMQTILAQSWAAKSPRSLFASRSHMRRRKSEEEPFEIVPTASLLAPLQCTYTEYVDENEVENLDGSDMEMSEDDARPSTSHTHLSLTAISDMMSPSNSAPEIETPRSYSPIPGKEDDFDYLRAIAAEMNLPFPESRFQDPPKLSYRVPLPFEDKLACSWTIVDELEEVPGPYVGVHWRLGISALNEEDNGAEDIQVSDEVMQLATAARDEKFEPEDLWDNLQDYQDGSSPLSSAYSEDEAILADLGEDGVKDSTATSVYSCAFVFVHNHLSEYCY